MREDFSKVITERPRDGGGLKTPKGSRREEQRYKEDFPKREKIRQKWSSAPKQFTDVIGPLYHFLLKQVGRKWDSVYSEIAKNFPKTSQQNIHVYTHIWEYVIKDVIIIDGVPHYKNNPYHNFKPLRNYGKRVKMYIHPETGILCRLKKSPPEFSDGERKPGIKVYPGVQYHKIKGIWYEVKVRKFPQNSDLTPEFYTHPIQDKVLEMTFWDEKELRKIYGGGFIGVSKRRLTKQEIRNACLEKTAQNLV